jgi:hypothetical protein
VSPKTLPPLTDLQREIYDVLPTRNRRGITARQVARELKKPNGQSVGRALAILREKGVAQGVAGEEWKRA